VAHRKVIDCRWYPSDTNCSLTLAGEEDEVVRAAAEHAIAVHGEKDSPHLREELRSMLVDEPPSWDLPPRPPAEQSSPTVQH